MEKIWGINMSYTSIDLLPHSVKAALIGNDDRRAWLNAFNKAYTKTPSFEKAVDSAYESLKSNPNLRWFEGWISTDHIDVQGDVMNQRGLFEALKKHVERGGLDVDLHSNRGVGSMYYVDLRKYDSEHLGIWGKGVVYHNEPSFNHIWSEIQKGQKNGFSIGGFAVEWKQTCNQNGCFREILKPSIQEVSHCTNPADPYANMMMYNELAKSAKLDEEHLSKDKQILTQIKALVEQMLADDEAEDVSPQGKSNMLENPKGDGINGVKVKGVKPIPNMLENAEGDTLPKTMQNAEIKNCGCGKSKEIKKIGTKQGACRGHQTKGNSLSSQCQGFGFIDKPTMGKESAIIIDDEFMEKPKPWKPQIFTDTRDKDAAEPLDIRAVNDQMASKFIKAFEDALQKETNPRVALALQKSLRIMSTSNGLPVTKRLKAIKSIGCPRCSSIVDQVSSSFIEITGGF